MNEVILKVENVSLEYKTRVGIFNTFKHKALDNVSFEVNKGDVLGILGKNGAGKSTLLKILSGVFKPDSGRVWVPPGTTRSLLTLGLGFNGDLSGRDNAILSCMFNGFSKTESIELSKEIHAFSELGDFFEQPVRTYSSGMRSKLGFSTGIVSHVDILLIDEVLSVGDKGFKAKAENAMMDKIGGKDQTVLFVSHSEKQIERICNKCFDLEVKGFVQKFKEERIVSPPPNVIIKLSPEILTLIIANDWNGLKNATRGKFYLLYNVGLSLEASHPRLAYEFFRDANKLRPEHEITKNKLFSNIR
ncbi:ABC transporter ATP-binding protein [Vibrio sp. 10N.286.48.F5]|uniref:ABC transporter ATP-binding protein n=1 Tax=Vibrio sp. 10N.286.48.F5 TaxID=3229699 RepID=UPI00354E7AF5